MVQEQAGNYLLEERIGHGTTGRVWRARHVETGELFAAKVLRDELADDPDARAKFITEGCLLAGRDLPGIVRVHDVIDEPDKVVLIMDWVDGGDLRALIAAGPVPPARAASLAATVADALATAQNAGMAHLDVKPENILLTADGTPLLTDFGLAKTLDTPSTSRTHSRAAGTPHYTAPETISGHRPAAPADVYALGVIIYELIMGWRPFRARAQAALMHQHLAERAVKPRAFPPILWSIVEQCLDKDPLCRPTAASLAERLRTAAITLSGMEAVPATDPPSDQELTTEWKNKPAPETPARPKRPRALVALVALGVVTALVGGLLALNQFVWSRASSQPKMAPIAEPVSSTPTASPTLNAEPTSTRTPTMTTAPPVVEPPPTSALPPVVQASSEPPPPTTEAPASPAPPTQTAPSEAPPVAQPPAQQAPVQPAPVQQAPVQQAPVQQAPGAPAPVKPPPAKPPVTTKRPACDSAGPLLGPGSRGTAVKEAQTLLKRKGHPEVGAIDGIWGPRTDTATRNFQRRAGLAVDGLIGPNTWCKLRS